jgi:hypothetical protein
MYYFHNASISLGSTSAFSIPIAPSTTLFRFYLHIIIIIETVEILGGAAL